MAKTRTQFLAYVKYDFKRDDKDTEILQAYNDTLQNIANMAPFEGLKFQSYIPTVAGQEDYPLPSNKCHVIHPVRLIESASSTNGWPLRKRSKQEFSEIYPNPNATGTSVARGKPSDYCIYSNSILIGKLPDLSTYLLELDWAKLRTSQDAGVDVHEMGEEWDEVIKFGVLMRLYAAMGFDDEAVKWKTFYEDPVVGFPLLLAKEKSQTETIGQVENREL